MVEINLLPWRQHVYSSKKKRMNYIVIAVSGCLVAAFIFTHLVLLMMSKKINSHALYLKNQLVESQPFSNRQSVSDVNAIADLERVKVSQVKLHDMLGKIARASACHIQIIKINYTDERVMLVGYVRSIYAVACWMKAFHNMPINNFKVETIAGSDLQQFSLTIG